MVPSGLRNRLYFLNHFTLWGKNCCPHVIRAVSRLLSTLWGLPPLLRVNLAKGTFFLESTHIQKLIVVGEQITTYLGLLWKKSDWLCLPQRSRRGKLALYHNLIFLAALFAPPLLFHVYLSVTMPCTPKFLVYAPHSDICLWVGQTAFNLVLNLTGFIPSQPTDLFKCVNQILWQKSGPTSHFCYYKICPPQILLLIQSIPKCNSWGPCNEKAGAMSLSSKLWIHDPNKLLLITPAQCWYIHKSIPTRQKQKMSQWVAY